MAVLTEHSLRIGGRVVTLLEGPAGWGECSLLDDYPCDPAKARRAAEEAANVGWPPAVRSDVPVNALVTAPSFAPSDLDGFDTVKVKVRSPADVDLVARVRDAVGPKVSLRVDGNGAWDLEIAAAIIKRLAPLGVDLVEQPVASLDELARLRRVVSLPLAADECVRSVADAQRLRSLDAADAVVLKVQPLGGVRAALDIAEAAGVPAIPTSMMETSVGLAAGLALAAALPELSHACGLGTASLLAADVTREPLIPERGVLRVRTVVPDRDLLELYADSRSGSSQEVTS